LLELAYTFSEQGLTYAKTPDGIVGQLEMHFLLVDSSGRTSLDATWIVSHPKSTEEDGELTGMKSFAVKPGRYMASLAFSDPADRSRHDSAIMSLRVRDYRAAALQLSDIEIISEVTPSDDQSNPFFKNGNIIDPIVTGVIVPPFLLINTYLEIYNANRVPTTEYALIYQLADSTGNVFYQQDLSRPRPVDRAIVEVHSLVLEQVPSGNYYLIVKWFNGLNESATDSAMVIKPFKLINPDRDVAIRSVQLAAVPTAVIEPQFSGMTEKELDDECARVKYIALQQEIDIWRKLAGDQPKARFMTDFWQKRDPTPGTPANEFREDYSKRLEATRRLYSTQMAPHGYESDRGRVLLSYGKPDEIDRHPHDVNTRPYEVWSYSRSQYYFVFIDRAGTGDYRLFDSNAPKEPRNQRWMHDVATMENFED
jgi:GWxTD domain-containing protein